MNDIIGNIQLLPYDFEIADYFICDGRILSIQEYAALYSLIGVNHGGDGINNFAIPNMLGKESNPGMNYYICYKGEYPMRY